MKKTKISVDFEIAKADALRFYMDKRQAAPEQELEKTLETLYEKFVPKDARELIEWQSSQEEGKAKTKRTRPNNGQNERDQTHSPINSAPMDNARNQ